MVSEEAFEVGLSFGGVPERVAVPFDAMTAFFDPAVQFGFQFETIETAAAADASAEARDAEKASAPAESFLRHRPRRRLCRRPPRLPPHRSSPELTAAPAAKWSRLDRFRKK